MNMNMDMRGKKKMRNFWAPESLLARLNKMNAETGAPVSELIRRAIAEYLDKRGY